MTEMGTGISAVPASDRPRGEPVLEARGLTKHFRVRSRPQRGQRRFRAVVHACEDVDVVLEAGRVTAVVGESGCGKTTLARMLARLIVPTKGEILLDGKPVRRGKLRQYRHRVQIVFQDPFASLNPIHTVRYQLSRPLKLHDRAHGHAEVDAAVEALLSRVKLAPPAQFADKLPASGSGSPSHGRLPPDRPCCSLTSRSRCSTSQSGLASSTCLAICATSRVWRSSTSPTTSHPPGTSPTP
jgi:ABC-type glutathione transport system ATPase component